MHGLSSASRLGPADGAGCTRLEDAVLWPWCPRIYVGSCTPDVFVKEYRLEDQDEIREASVRFVLDNPRRQHDLLLSTDLRRSGRGTFVSPGCA